VRVIRILGFAERRDSFDLARRLYEETQPAAARPPDAVHGSGTEPTDAG
jgi:hypothetical protein